MILHQNCAVYTSFSLESCMDMDYHRHRDHECEYRGSNVLVLHDIGNNYLVYNKNNSQFLIYLV